jgi:hypothetical protein
MKKLFKKSISMLLAMALLLSLTFIPAVAYGETVAAGQKIELTISGKTDEYFGDNASWYVLYPNTLTLDATSIEWVNDCATEVNAANASNHFVEVYINQILPDTMGAPYSYVFGKYGARLCVDDDGIFFGEDEYSYLGGEVPIDTAGESEEFLKMEFTASAGLTITAETFDLFFIAGKELDNLTLSYNVIGGGGVNPAYDSNYGTITKIADSKFTVTANTGYAIDVLTVDGTNDALAHGLITYNTPNAPTEDLFASFERTLSIGANGTVKVIERDDETVNITLNDGDIVYADDILEITPTSGYEVSATTGLNFVSGKTYNAVTAQTTLLSVTFAAVSTSTINSGHGHGGSISHTGSSYTVTANANFAIDKLWVNGAEVSGAHGETTWTGTPTASVFATFAHTINFT